MHAGRIRDTAPPPVVIFDFDSEHTTTTVAAKSYSTTSSQRRHCHSATIFYILVCFSVPHASRDLHVAFGILVCGTNSIDFFPTVPHTASIRHPLFVAPVYLISQHAGPKRSGGRPM